MLALVICTFVFAYAKSRFSDDMAQLSVEAGLVLYFGMFYRPLIYLKPGCQQTIGVLYGVNSCIVHRPLIYLKPGCQQTIGVLYGVNKWCLPL